MAAVAEDKKKISAWRALGRALGNRKTGFMLLFGFASGLPFALFLGTLFAWLTEAEVDLETNTQQSRWGKEPPKGVERDLLAGPSFRRSEFMRVVRIAAEFIDESGMEEPGIDGGGLFKEFLTELTVKAFDPRMGVFTSTPANELYPNPGSARVM